MTRSVIVWDTEPTQFREAHLRDTTIYCTSGLWGWMQAVWGGGVTAVKTATDPKTGDVMVYKAQPDEAGAVPLRFVGPGRSAEFSFVRPLRKVDLHLPPGRLFNVTPFARTEAIGTVFVFPLAQRQVVSRRVQNLAGFYGQVGEDHPVEEVAPLEPSLPVDE